MKKTIIINGIIDDLQLELFNNEYINNRKNDIISTITNYDEIEKRIIIRLLDSFNLKEILIFGNEDLKMDSLPLRILPELKQKFPQISFEELYFHMGV